MAQRSGNWFSRWLGGQKKSVVGYGALPAQQTYVTGPGQPVWMRRDYAKFAEEGFARNVIAYRCVTLIAHAAASVDFIIRGAGAAMPNHSVLKLLKKPNPAIGGAEFFESVLSYKLVSGNAYVQAVGPEGQPPRELYALRPDRVKVLAGRNGVAGGYRYQVGERYTDFRVDRLTGRSAILHLKTFHPLDDWYGLSPVEAAAYSIDQHNQAGAWNQALLQNGARPSGALVVKGEGGLSGHLSEDQYQRLKGQIDDLYSGPANAGRPILLEGGLDWKELSLSPRDMDFLNAKHAAARDIALAFGVPPQLLGIPGDNTYSNLAEARLALWEQTVLPLLDNLCDALNAWLMPQFGGKAALGYDADAIPALATRRESLWEKIKGADFLTDAEKRRLVGIE